jgi:hypothetical protein
MKKQGGKRLDFAERSLFLATKFKRCGKTARDDASESLASFATERGRNGKGKYPQSFKRFISQQTSILKKKSQRLFLSRNSFASQLSDKENRLCSQTAAKPPKKDFSRFFAQSNIVIRTNNPAKTRRARKNQLPQEPNQSKPSFRESTAWKSKSMTTRKTGDRLGSSSSRFQKQKKPSIFAQRKLRREMEVYSQCVIDGFLREGVSIEFQTGKHLTEKKIRKKFTRHKNNKVKESLE